VGGGGGVNARPQPFYPQERDPVTTVYEAGWAPWPVWTDAENLAPDAIRSPDRQARTESLYQLRQIGPPYRQNKR